MGPRTDIRYEEFQCVRLGNNLARITVNYKIHSSGNEALTDLDCDGCKECGVGMLTGPGLWNFDWGKCIHPRLHK